MNNSLATFAVDISESPVDVTPQLQEREAKLGRIIEALQAVRESKAWSTLKTEIFDDLTTRYSKELAAEAKKDNPESNKLNRIAGQLAWAERYADLAKLETTYRTELTGIRKKLQEPHD